ncbi:MAG: YiiX/YebB-like N1pC/P60 family cysteine hydrolase [Bacteroidales bacterium]
MHKNFYLLLFQLFFFYHLINAQKLNLKEGDLLFQHLMCGDFCQAIEKVTPAYQNMHFTHVGILIKDEQNQWVVAEAISKGVCLTKLDTFIHRSGKKNIFVGRVKPEYKIPTLKEIKKFLGKPYDTAFNIYNDAYYCSELVYNLYLDNNGKPIFQLSPMTFKDPETNEYLPAWINYFNDLNMPIPEGELGLNPGSMINSKELFQSIFVFE